MCDVHLIEQGREERVLSGTCCYCGIAIDGPGIFIWGITDDGAPGVLEFTYHIDCAEDMAIDYDVIDANDGCFSYGSPIRVAP